MISVNLPCMATVVERRAAMFEFFKGLRDPALAVGEEIVVPDFRPRLRELGLRGVHFLLHALARASLHVPQFRLRARAGEIVELSAAELYCSYVVQNPHTDVNHCTVLFNPDLKIFATAAQQQEPHAQQSSEIIPPAPDPNHITAVNLSIIPWLRLATLVQGSCSPVPLFTIGKFITDQSERLTFNLHILVHHGLVDAYHVHQFIEQFRLNVSELLA